MIVTRFAPSICAMAVVVACLPVATWTFVTHPTTTTTSTRRTTTTTASYRFTNQPHTRQSEFKSPSRGPSERVHQLLYTRRPFVCPLLAKAGDDDADPLESEGWEPGEEDLEELESSLDVDELDLDDVESSVAGTNADEYDEDIDDDIDYDDDEDTGVEGSDEDEFDEDDDDEEEDDDDIEEEDDEDTDEDDDIDDYDIENKEELDALLQSGGMTEKPPEGFSKWWEDYGFDSREDFDNHELFPGGVAGLMESNYESPDDDFWDDEVTMVPLMEDPEDETYNANLKSILESSTKRKAEAAMTAATARSQRVAFDDEEPINEFDTIDELSELLDKAIPGDPNGAEKEATLDASDLEGMDVRKEMMESTNLIDDEPYVIANRTNIAGTGVSDEDMEALDKSWKTINEVTSKEPWNKVAQQQFDFDYDAYPKQYHYDMQETAVEIGSASYNVYPWLKYDMGFNVSNLILAAVQHNPNAPVILQHWYPQLMVCERYQHARDRNFDFTWEDVQGADMAELEEYYLGFGYKEIPQKVQSETGMISFEEADEQETKMAAMEKWMLDVYNSEWDRKDFDDEDIKDEDNVFSDNFKMPQHPDLPAWDDAQEDIAGWNEEWESRTTATTEGDGDEGDDDDAARKENIAYRDRMGQSIDFTNVQDDDFQKNYRGHLVVACGNFDEDLEKAEEITERMEKEFGNAIYTETKIYQHAMPADNVFEVWLESYEIDLLHSKRRAFMGVDGWEGLEEVTNERMDYLVTEISKLTSDDARNSFRWSEEHVS